MSLFVSDLTDTSCRKLLEQALIGEVDESNIDSLIHHSMKEKRGEILLAMEGVFSPTLKFLARTILNHIDATTEHIKVLDNLINNKIEDYEVAIKKNAGAPDNI